MIFQMNKKGMNKRSIDYYGTTCENENFNWILKQKGVNRLKIIKLSNWLANVKKLPFELKGVIIEEREKAVKVEYQTTNTVWLPKSHIEIVEIKEK